jgi:hypothetical protein
MKTKNRIKLNDRFLDVMVKMAEGNPGAATALMEITANAEAIDPESALKWLGPLVTLDSYGLYGSEIYIIWNDICQRNTRNFIMLLRAVQLGIISMIDITNQIKNGRGYQFSEERFKEIDEEVCTNLLKFKKMEV